MALPDNISRCTGKGCHLRTNCQRYLDESYQGERFVMLPVVLIGRTGPQCVNQIPLSNEKKD